MVCLRYSVPSITSATLEEKTLLNKLAQGDRDAFWPLWELYRNYLYHRCRIWMGGNDLDGEEALSLATLKAWEKLPNYADQITNVKGWLTRMTHNLCVDLHRKRKRSAMSIESIEEIAIEDQNILTAGSDSPESAMLRSELGIVISQGINALTPKIRNTFILRFYKDMSYQDIAQKLDISLDNAYKRIQKAREFLQKYLNQYFSGRDNAFLNITNQESMKKRSQADETMICDSLLPTIEISS